MGFFTAGNLITLGIVLLILVLYRQMDRGNRNLKLLRDYAEKLKKDLHSFVEEQEKAVKDYGVSLNVERESARELMKRLQMTDEELAEKAEAVSRLDKQIAAYEKSLAELDRMAGRVQENMNRIREESAFVEAAGRRIADAKAKVEELEKQLGSTEERFNRDNAEALGKTAEGVVASIKSAVSNMSETAETARQQVETHRKEIAKAEAARAANMARDLERVDKILTKAVEQAGQRADRMEEAALVHLKERAEDRVQKIKTAEEERLRSYQESAKARVTEVQGLVKSIKEDWRAERGNWDTQDKAYEEAREKRMHELSQRFMDSEKRISDDMSALAKRMEDLSVRAEGIVSSQEGLLLKAAEAMKQKALEITGAKLEEYRKVQNLEFKRLETLADDSRNLDAELRRNMEEVIGRIREDFVKYERDSENARKAEANKFSVSAAALANEITKMDNELNALKSSAYENVSAKLKVFEDDFFADLAKRSGDVDKRLAEWQENIDTKLSGLGEEAEAARRELEHSFTEELKKKLSAQDERLISELEHLKAEAGAFEEGIRGQISVADDFMISYKEQLDRSLEDTRKDAEVFIKSEIGKYSLESAEIIKKYQRELEEAKSGLDGKIKELDSTVGDARRRIQELSAETDNRIASVRSAVEDAEKHIREAVDQTKLVDRAEDLRLEMERRIEDLKADMDHLDQRRAEASQLENDFVKIKRLEDDVNAKMTRFLSEKRRLDTMEADFNRLLQVSRAVEDKLVQVTGSDDTLQGVQLQIRKLEEALGTTEEKYQRLEKKNQILDSTNDGVDRNFKTLQESEKLSVKMGGELDRYAEDIASMKTAIEKLAGESEKARDAAGKIDELDDALEHIEERIASMQRARQWIADAETRLEDLNKQAQNQARLIDSMVKGKKSKALPDLGEGAPPPQKKENVISLARQGWKADEIAKAMKISRGEVELILEMSPKD